MFLLVIDIFWLFLTGSYAELSHWDDANTIKHKNISYRHGRIDWSSAGKAAVWGFCLPLAICCTRGQENVGNWPLFKLDSKWTCERKWMLSCSLLKQACMLLFTGISSNANLFCQCLFSMCFLSLVIYTVTCLRTACKHMASFCECGNKVEGCRELLTNSEDVVPESWFQVLYANGYSCYFCFPSILLIVLACRQDAAEAFQLTWLEAGRFFSCMFFSDSASGFCVDVWSEYNAE